jgi:hypothetical protein
VIGIRSAANLEQALLGHRGNIVGILFCTYRKNDPSLHGTWPESFEDWHIYSGHDIDILAPGYSVHGAQPGQTDGLVRDLPRGMKLWFSREGLFECADLIIEKTDRRWSYSGQLNLIFVSVGEQLGIDWGGIAAVDVGALVHHQIYASADQFMFEFISAFKGRHRPSNVPGLYRELVKLPTIKKYAGSAASAAPRIIMDALKLVVSGR